VDFWVALIDPVGRVQHESAFHKSGLVRAGNKSRSPLLEFPVLRDRRRVDRLRPNPAKKQALNRPRRRQRAQFHGKEKHRLYAFRRDDWSNSDMVANALFGDGARSRC
jgi:hypothetical protein